MPILTRKEFAIRAGRLVTAINLDIGRDKLSHLPGNKKLLDTDNPLNAAYIIKWRAEDISDLLGDVVIAPVKDQLDAIIEHKKAKLPVEPKEIQQKTKQIAAQTARDMRRVDQDMAKKEQDMELQALKIQSEKIRLDKTAGNLLPIDLVTGVIERHANSILKTFEKGFERVAEIYSNMAGFNPAVRAEFLKECRTELADCVKNAGEAAEKEIEILVDDYSETLMVGQKKA